VFRNCDIAEISGNATSSHRAAVIAEGDFTLHGRESGIISLNGFRDEDGGAVR
jgi:hypothetical protein